MSKKKNYVLDVPKIKRDLEKVNNELVRKSDIANISDVTLTTLINWEKVPQKVLRLINHYETETGNKLSDILIEV